MKIRKKLYLMFLIILILLSAVVIIILAVNKKINTVSSELVITSKISSNLTNLNTFTNEYLLYGEERMLAQWEVSYNSLLKLVESAESQVDFIEEHQLFRLIKSDLGSIKKLFSRLIIISEMKKKLTSEGAASKNIETISSLEKRLISQLYIISGNIVINGQMVQDTINDEMKDAQKKASVLIVSSLFFFGIFLISALFFTYRNIYYPIKSLAKNAEFIGRGDLDHKIDFRSKDEIGELSRNFDDMRLKLKMSYSGLEDKVREKTVELYNTVEKLQELNVDLQNTQSAILNLVEDLEDSKGKLEVEIVEHEKAEIELIKHKDNLEVMVQERTIELEMSNNYLEEAVKELETFSYSISHDLKAPLRAISGYSGMLHEDYSGSLDEEGNRLLSVISDNAIQMNQLIEDILQYSRLARRPLEMGEVHIRKLTEGVIRELDVLCKDRDIEFNVLEMPDCKGDSVMVKQVLMNLLNNAIKYTGNKEKAEIEAGSRQIDNETVYYVKDNGVGFDMKYSDKLFGLFQRLHSTKEFEGTGVGLAIVQRLINKHHGKIWAEAKVNEGATFFFAFG